MINRVLQRVEDGQLDRVLIEAPPRHGKSELSTHYFPAWFAGRNPALDIMIHTHTQPLASKFGRDARDTLDAYGPDLWGRYVSAVSASASDWQVAGYPGRLFAFGRGGSPLGRGAHLLLIDDPYGSKDDAMSETIRADVWETWTGTLRNRLEPGARVVIIMQRWHEEDLIGQLKARDGVTADGGRWHLVSMPAIAEDVEFWPGTNQVFREPGQALWPERFPIEVLEEIKRDLEEWESEYFWAAQYQQRPAPLGGGLFKDEWFQFFTVDDANGVFVLERADGQTYRYTISDCWSFLTCDPAFSEKRSADWTVIGHWAVTPNGDLLKLDHVRERIDSAYVPDRLATMQRLCFPQPSAIWVEADGGGITIANGGRRLGLPIYDLKAEGDKYIRAMALQARMGSGHVYFRKGASWFRVLRDEFLVFPNGKYDDQVDESAYAAKVLSNRGTGRTRSIRRALR